MKKRNAVIEDIRNTQLYDVIVIGGGASGIGAAVEACLRGYRTLLLEKHDFTKGTSSKSTKLIHGGVRYMAQGDLKMVREALKERGILLRNAPHLVHDQPFIIPNYRWWEGAFYTIGLKFYDLLAGRFSLGKSVRLGKDSVLEKLPGISPEKLRGGVLYHDGQFDDSRLAMDLLHVLNKKGGTALNYAEVLALEKKEDIVSGVVFRDNNENRQFAVRAKAVLNATGVWVDEVMKMDQPGHRRTIRPSQGIHLVLKKYFLRGDHALMIPKTSDGRVLFAVPWHGHLVVGTTDTPIHVSSAEPVALEEEIRFILDTASAYLERDVKRSDVLSVFAGLRPLAAPKDGSSKTKEISRNHKIMVSKSKLITIIGGKWTTYRKMAEEMVDTAIRSGLLEPSSSMTKNFILMEPSSGMTKGSVIVKPSKRHTIEKGVAETVPDDDAFHLYGDNGADIAAIAEKDQEKMAFIHPDLPYRWAEVEWICKNEMVLHLEDLLARRLRALLLNARATSDIAAEVAERSAPWLGWTPEQANAEVVAFRELAENYMLK